jgi:hypothetical protein
MANISDVNASDEFVGWAKTEGASTEALHEWKEMRDKWLKKGVNKK